MTTESDEKPSRSVRQMQEQLELWINEHSADLTVFRVTLQIMFLTMLANNPHKEAVLGGLKDEVLRALDRMNPSHDPTNGLERAKQLTLMRAERFFQEVQTALLISSNTGGPSATS
jgi:hypothetical protein